MLTFSEYMPQAMRTCPTTLTDTDKLKNAAFGLIGEIGEVADLFKKSLYQGHELRIDDLTKELGDVCWYIAQAATALNVNPEGTECENISYDEILFVLADCASNAGTIARGVHLGMLEGGSLAGNSLLSSILTGVMALAKKYGIESILEKNIDKLKTRYPQGFTAKASVERKA